MDAFEFPDLILRLRHLDAIEGRNFHLQNELSHASGIMFAISLIDSDDFGYFFVSNICENLNYPSWEALDLTNCCPQWVLASKGAVFTFFAVQGHTNSVLFEIKVYFSGLVSIDAKAHAVHTGATSQNEVYFQFSGVQYSPPNNLSPVTCSQCIRSRSALRANWKPSYDFEALQKFVVHAEIMQNQLMRMKAMNHSMNMLRSSLVDVLDERGEREAKLVELCLLKRHLKSAKSRLEESRANLHRISNERSMIEDLLKQLAHRHQSVNAQFAATSSKVSRLSSHLEKLEAVTTCRIAQLVYQLMDIFGAELKSLDPRNTVAFDSLELLDSGLNHPGIFVQLNPGQLKVELPEVVTPHATETTLSNHAFTVKPALPADSSSVRSVNTSSETDLVMASSKFGTIALVLRFLAAVLNHPLRYPLDISEGTSRAKVIDYLATELVDGEQSFPIYLSRSSLLPAYKHAISLLNRDISELRAFVGMPTPVEEATIGNLRTLLQYCFSEKFCSKI